MMSGFFKRLFGAGGSNDNAGKPADPVMYKGYIIHAAPKKGDSHFNVAGTIVREDDPDGEVHKFIRADTYASLEDAVTWSVRKAQQIIDEQGDRLIPKKQ